MFGTLNEVAAMAARPRSRPPPDPALHPARGCDHSPGGPGSRFSVWGDEAVRRLDFPSLYSSADRRRLADHWLPAAALEQELREAGLLPEGPVERIADAAGASRLDLYVLRLTPPPAVPDSAVRP